MPCPVHRPVALLAAVQRAARRRRLPPGVDADDVVQCVLVYVVEKNGAMARAEGHDLDRFANRAVYCRAVDLIRAVARRRAVPLDALDFPSSGPTPEAELIDREQTQDEADALRAARELPTLAALLDGVTLSAQARAENVHASTITRRARRDIHNLRSTLSK